MEDGTSPDQHAQCRPAECGLNRGPTKGTGTLEHTGSWRPELIWAFCREDSRNLGRKVTPEESRRSWLLPPLCFFPSLSLSMKVTQKRNWGEWEQLMGPLLCFVWLAFSKFISISVFSGKSSEFPGPLKSVAWSQWS